MKSAVTTRLLAWRGSWLRVTDHALDFGKLPAQQAFQRVHRVVDLAYGKCRIDAAMEIDDLAHSCVARPHIMDFAKIGNLTGQHDQCVAHFADPRIGSVTA